jgi:hypothetical protein
VSQAVSVAQKAVASVLLLAALVYAGDYLLVRYRMAYAKSGNALGTVEMMRLYAIPLKDGKTEYDLDAQQPEVTTPCVHSLFSHMGYSPCWYLKRNSQKPIPM